MKAKSRIKLFFTAAVTVILAATAFFLPASKKRAEAAFYCYFDGITAISKIEGGLLVSDGNGTTLLDENDSAASLSLPANVDGFAFGNSTLFAVAGGEVFSVDISSDTVASVISDNGFYAQYVSASENGLAVASKSEIRFYSYTDYSFSSSAPIGTVSGLACYEGEFLYSVFDGYRSSVYSAADNSLIFDRLSFYTGLSSDSSSLFAINRSGNVVKLTDTGAAELTSDKFVVAVYPAADGALYYATDRNELYSLVDKANTLLAASDSNELGFYSSPLYATARFSNAYVADYLNDRVAIISADNVSYLPFVRPTAVAVDNLGKLYVSHSGNVISVVDTDGSVLQLFSAQKAITSLVCDNDNVLYAIIGDKACKISDNDAVELAQASALFTDVSGEYVFYALNKSVYEIDGTAVFSASEDIVWACADGDGSIFYLTASNLIKRASDGSETVVTDGFSGGNFVTIAKASTMLSAYGDVVVVDSLTSRVYSITASSAGVTLPSSAPVVTPFDSEGIIREVLYDCTLYSTPLENEVKFNLKKGANVIVTKYGISGGEGFAYCYYEDEASRTLYGGYVFKSNLSEPKPYVAPPAATGILFLASANLYAIPSVYSEKLAADMPKGTELALLSFAEYESKDGKWYRASTSDGKIGYVLANTVSVRGFIPDGIRPQYNAEIISHKGSVGANVYIKQDGKMQKVDGIFLLVGTKVEVVEPFDTSEKYTKIIFFDEKLGSYTAWVETVYVDYNSFSIVQVVAIVIIVATVILLGILLIRIHQKHRKI